AGPVPGGAARAPPAPGRPRARGAGPAAVPPGTGAPGPPPAASSPAPSTRSHNSPPGLAAASTADPGGTSTRRLTRPSRPGAVSSRVRTTTSMPLSSQIGAFQVFAGQQLSRGTFEHDLPGRQDVA